MFCAPDNQKNVKKYNLIWIEKSDMVGENCKVTHLNVIITLQIIFIRYN